MIDYDEKIIVNLQINKIPVQTKGIIMIDYDEKIIVYLKIINHSSDNCSTIKSGETMTWYSSLRHYPYLFYHYVIHRNKPLLASLNPHYRCNLTCQQCPFYAMQAEGLRYEQVLDVLERLYQRGNRLVVLEGGEPMLWKDGAYSIHDVVSAAKRKFFSVGMTTNGSLPLDVAVDTLWVSIDGLEATHNALRGAPIFSRIMDNIKKSQHSRLYTHITINSVNATEIPELIRFLACKVRGMTVQFYYPYNHKDELFLDFDRREKLLEEIIQLKRQGYQNSQF